MTRWTRPRLKLATLLLVALAALWGGAARVAYAQVCPTDPLAPAKTPVVALQTHGGPKYGTMQYPLAAPMADHQIALTFDDGPDPRGNPRVLDILDQHCIKATFFMVGWYAQARPDLVRAVAARGHTIGTHSWLHPNNIRRLSYEAGQREIARGFTAVSDALSPAPAADRARLAPFFRYPGLNDSRSLSAWLAQTNVAVVSCDIGADDWKGISAAEIQRRALRNIAEAGRGILILHETRPHTVEVLSNLIVELERRGYRFVQLVPAA